MALTGTLSFAASFKQRIHGVAVFAVLLFLAGQIAGLFHLVEHTAEGNNDHCEMCSLALHLGDITTVDAVELVIAVQKVAMVILIILPVFPSSFLKIYSSRAPPFSE